MASPDELQRLLPWWRKLVHRVLIARRSRGTSEVREEDQADRDRQIAKRLNRGDQAWWLRIDDKLMARLERRGWPVTCACGQVGIRRRSAQP
jgi:hypothetical protein